MRRILLALLLALTCAWGAGGIHGHANAQMMGVSSGGVFGTAAGCGSGGFQLCAHTVVVGTNSTTLTTPAIATTGANLIVVAVSMNNSVTTPGTLTDSLGNTWTLATSRGLSTGGDPYSALYYCFAPTVGASQTFTYTTVSSGFPGLAVEAWSGAAATPLDQTNAGTASTSLTVTPSSITPTANNELIVTGVDYKTTSTISVSAGMTISDTGAPTGGGFGVSMAYFVQGTAAAYQPTWTFGTSQAALTTVIGSFK